MTAEHTDELGRLWAENERLRKVNTLTADLLGQADVKIKALRAALVKRNAEIIKLLRIIDKSGVASRS